MSGILDTISYLGDTVDKFTGSRALRGLLGGKPREALSILPFSDTSGLTDPSQTALVSFCVFKILQARSR